MCHNSQGKDTKWGKWAPAVGPQKPWVWIMNKVSLEMWQAKRGLKAEKEKEEGYERKDQVAGGEERLDTDSQCQLQLCWSLWLNLKGSAKDKNTKLISYPCWATAEEKLSVWVLGTVFMNPGRTF